MACHSPLMVQRSKYRPQLIPIPCGKCPPCLKRRVDAWVFRLRQEDLISSSAHFVTLTYDTNHVPITNNGFMTLKKDDFQKFMKRLRKKTDNKLRYYAAGEYGDQNWRPHYHAIIFNCPQTAHFHSAWSIYHKKSDTYIPIGHVDIGTVSGDSIAYTAKYIHKSKRIPLHARDDRIPEFSLMSKGLGDNYITPATKNYHKKNLDQLYLTNPGGHKIAMPRYYRDKIFTDQEKAQQVDLVQNALALEKAKIMLTVENYDDYIYQQKIATWKKFQLLKKRKPRKL